MVKNIFLDEVLKSYIVPTELRDNSIADGGRLFTSGTRIKLDEDVKFLRLFSAWATENGEEGDTDIDLGAMFIRNDDTVERLSFYSQHNKLGSHSGDFTDSREYNDKDGLMTAEYIDIDLEACSDENIKYILSGSFIYSRAENFVDNLQCYSGVQLLSNLRTERNQHININNNLFKMKLVGDYQSHTPLAIDLETKEIVIMDKYNKGKQGITIDSISKQLDLYKQLYFNALDYKSNMYDFLSVFIESNQDKYNLVNSVNEADVVCSYNNFKLEPHQEMYNISNNLEEILGLLN